MMLRRKSSGRLAHLSKVTNNRDEGGDLQLRLTNIPLIPFQMQQHWSLHSRPLGLRSDNDCDDEANNATQGEDPAMCAERVRSAADRTSSSASTTGASPSTSTAITTMIAGTTRTSRTPAITTSVQRFVELIGAE